MPGQTAYSLTLPRASTGHVPGRPWPAILALAASIALFASVLTPRLLPVATPAAVAIQPEVAAPERASSGPSQPETALVSETSSAVFEVASGQAGASDAAIQVQQPVALAPTSTGDTSVMVQPAPAPAAPAPQAPPAVLPGQRWLSEGFVFVIEGQEWDADSFTNVDAALSKLPARIRSQLGNRALGPISILVNRSGRALSGKQPYGGAANFFSTNDGRNELVLFPGQSTLTILHELGHSFNLRNAAPGKYALVLLDPEMQSFMAATGWRVLSTPDQVRTARDHMGVQMAYDGSPIWPRLSNNDPLEDFANSFALYFFSPDDLRVKSPERFAWFEQYVGR